MAPKFTKMPSFEAIVATRRQQWGMAVVLLAAELSMFFVVAGWYFATQSPTNGFTEYVTFGQRQSGLVTSIVSPGLGFLAMPLIIAVVMPHSRGCPEGFVFRKTGYLSRMLATTLLWAAGIVSAGVMFHDWSDKGYRLTPGSAIAMGILAVGLAGAVAMWPNRHPRIVSPPPTEAPTTAVPPLPPTASQQPPSTVKAPPVPPQMPAPTGTEQPPSPTGAPAPRAQAGWYADPSRQHELRYWNGTRWADDVVDHGQRSLAPL